MALYQWLVEAAHEQLDPWSGEAEDARLATLPAPLRGAWLLSWMDTEITLGSLTGYLTNSHGRHAPLARDVLREVGARRTADVLDRAITSCARQPRSLDGVHRDGTQPFDVVQPYADLANADELSDLTDEYWDVVEAENCQSMFVEHVRPQVEALGLADRDEG